MIFFPVFGCNTFIIPNMRNPNIMSRHDNVYLLAMVNIKLAIDFMICSSKRLVRSHDAMFIENETTNDINKIYKDTFRI